MVSHRSIKRASDIDRSGCVVNEAACVAKSLERSSDIRVDNTPQTNQPPRSFSFRICASLSRRVLTTVLFSCRMSARLDKPLLVTQTFDIAFDIRRASDVIDRTPPPGRQGASTAKDSAFSIRIYRRFVRVLRAVVRHLVY